MPIKPYLQLVRLPNVFTAAADSLAGWLLAVGTFERPGQWVPLVAASACIYAGGITLNDVFDVEIDRVERPDRPIPSGKVSGVVASLMGGILLAAGLALVVVSAVNGASVVAMALVACVVGYDAGLKRTLLGPEVMGACRGLNLLLGLQGAAESGGPPLWLAAVAYGCFVTGITWVDKELWHGTWEQEKSDIRRIDPQSGDVLELIEMPEGVSVSGLESNGDDLFFCGGASTGKVRAVRKPTKRAQSVTVG